MHVTVKTFAQLREQLGFAERDVEVGDPCRVVDVWQAISGETKLPRHVLAAVNLDYAQAEAPVSDGDEVAFFPPVTGGASP